jgi:hypothetical protein
LENRKPGTAADLIIPLDRTGGILYEGLHRNQDFRRIPLARFRDYEQADRDLLRALKDAEAQGVYSGIAPENMPVFLHGYALSLREEFLGNPGDEEKRAAWIRVRTDYFKSLEAFLGGPSEANLVSGFEDLIATEKLSAEGSARLVLMRDALISTFAGLGEKYHALLDMRSSLAEELASSFCIMGPPSDTTEHSGVTIPAGATAPSDAEASALLANTLFSGSFVSPAQTRYTLFWSLLAAFLALAAIHRLRPPAGFPVGLILSLLCGAGFSWSFIISGYWIDPVISAASIFAGTVVMFLVSALIIWKGARHFRLAYGPYVSTACLKELIHSGRPLPEESISTQSAIMVIRENGLLAREDRLDPPIAAKALGDFRSKAAEAFIKAGAVVLGYEADMVLACFGSPLERGAPGNPAARAGGFITELLQQKDLSASWRFGVDCGECVFSWTAGTGYTAAGRPVVRSRILSGLAFRYHARVLISETVRERINLPVRKLQSLGEQGGAIKENFYELLVKG